MQRFKIAATILIFGGGLAGAYLIIKNSVPIIGIKNETIEKSSISGNAVIAKPIQWIKDLSFENISDVFEEKKSSINQRGIVLNNSNQMNNYTESIAGSIFNRMKMMDQNGKNPFENFNLNNQEKERLLQEAFGNFSNPFSVFYQPINENNLAVINDNSLNVQIKYYEDYQKTIKSAFGDFKKDSAEILNDVFKKNDFSSARKATEIYKTLTENFIKLSVPSSLLEFHKKNIQHYQNAFMIYQAILYYPEDPLKAYLAVEAIPQLYDETSEIQDLTVKTIEDRARKFNL